MRYGTTTIVDIRRQKVNLRSQTFQPIRHSDRFTFALEKCKFQISITLTVVYRDFSKCPQCFKIGCYFLSHCRKMTIRSHTEQLRLGS